ncbi:MAG: type II toxin-antitoxin system Phd/YefM family antitoxin, partial [Verrucomicrobiota bacterium]
MHTTNIHEAKTHLSSLLEQVARGQEVIISNRGTPVAKLIPYTPKPRELGMLEDQHFETDDCWHADSEI